MILIYFDVLLLCRSNLSAITKMSSVLVVENISDDNGDVAVQFSAGVYSILELILQRSICPRINLNYSLVYSS